VPKELLESAAGTLGHAVLLASCNKNSGRKRREEEPSKEGREEERRRSRRLAVASASSLVPPPSRALLPPAQSRSTTFLDVDQKYASPTPPLPLPEDQAEFVSLASPAHSKHLLLTQHTYTILAHHPTPPATATEQE
jgi:hypothetical protein